MGKVINFGGSGNFLWEAKNGTKYKFRANDKYEKAIELYSNDLNMGVIVNGCYLTANKFGLLANYVFSSTSSNSENKIYCDQINFLGVKNIEILHLTSTNDNGEEIFAVDVVPYFIFLQEFNSEVKLKISNIDKSNKTFTVSRSDNSGEEVTFFVLILS